MTYIPPHSGLRGIIVTTPNDENYKTKTADELKRLLQIYRDSLGDILAKLMFSYDAAEEYGIPIDSETKRLSFNKIIVLHRRIKKIMKLLKKDIPDYVPAAFTNARQLFNEKQKGIYKAIAKLNTSAAVAETETQTRARLKLFSDIIKITRSGSNTLFRSVLAPTGRGDRANINAAYNAATTMRPNAATHVPAPKVHIPAEPSTRPPITTNSVLHLPPDNLSPSPSPEVCGEQCLQRGRQWRRWILDIFGRSTGGGTRKHKVQKLRSTCKRSV